jgi:hypothetical protein
VEDETNKYIRQSVWNTVQYRWEKYFTCIFNEILLKTLCYRYCLREQFRHWPSTLPHIIKLLRKKTRTHKYNYIWRI